MKIKENYQCEYCLEVFDDREDCLDHEKNCDFKRIKDYKSKYNIHKCKCCFGCKFYQRDDIHKSVLNCHKHINIDFVISDYDTCNFWEKDPNVGTWDIE